MQRVYHQLIPILFIFFTLSLINFSVFTDDADARSRSGGRSFSRSKTYSKPPTRTQPAPTTRKSSSGSFMKGMAGGLVGGAIGSMLFGSLAHGGDGGGFGGSGIGLFQILIFGALAYFMYKRFFKKKMSTYSQYQQPTSTMTGGFTNPSNRDFPPPPPHAGAETVADGIAMIRNSEPDFDPEHFKEVAQDVFFQVQAGWMRRDISSYRHLLGDQLAKEYTSQLEEMANKGHINKLENIAVRSVELVDAGVDGNEEFVALSFKANLLDYTVDEKSNEVVEGSTTSPVKFSEKWTWARQIGTDNWRLEGIDIEN